MKQIHTFGGQRRQRNLTLPDIRAAKAVAVAASGVDMMSVTPLRSDETRPSHRPCIRAALDRLRPVHE